MSLSPSDFQPIYVRTLLAQATSTRTLKQSALGESRRRNFAGDREPSAQLGAPLF